MGAFSQNVVDRGDQDGLRSVPVRVVEDEKLIVLVGVVHRVRLLVERVQMHGDLGGRLLGEHDAERVAGAVLGEAGAAPGFLDHQPEQIVVGDVHVECALADDGHG